MLAFLYVKPNSKKFMKKYPFLMPMSVYIFLLRFKANHLGKMRGYPHVSLWIPIALAKSTFSACSKTGAKPVEELSADSCPAEI